MLLPEGDTIFRAAAALRRAMVGATLESFESDDPALAAAAERLRLAGRTVKEVEARGKNVLMTFSREGAEDALLRTHMRMTGAWHLYRPGERWRRSARSARLVLRAGGWVAPCFAAPVVEILPARRMAARAELRRLGPDATADEFDAGEALARLRALPEAEIAAALLRQDALAGIGNVIKSEALFLERASPFLRVAELSDDALAAIVRTARRLLLANRASSPRRTRPSLDPRARLWVYGRAGEPCFACGEPVRVRRHGPHARSTWFCPRCQRAAGPIPEASP